jgi:parvulin-like peptidyl-prolyl isomerase
MNTFSLYIISLIFLLSITRVSPAIDSNDPIGSLQMPEPPARHQVVIPQEDEISSESHESRQTRKPQLYPIDEVKAVIFFNEGMQVVASSDIKRSFDGRPRTLEDILSMYVLYDTATNRYKIPVSEDTVDKYFASLQQQHNLTMEQIKEMFAQGGFTYEQGRQELKMMYANNSLLQFLVESRLVVTEEMVKEYHESHPVLIESNYQIQLASIPLSEGQSKADLKKQVDTYIETGMGLDPQWSEVFEMKKDDFAEDKKAILDLEVNQIFTQETSDGLDLFKLIFKQDEGFLPLDVKRYQEIEMRIKEPLFYEMVEKIRQELLNEASIVYPKNATTIHSE